MLEALKFVERATSDKDVLPILTHICVHDGKLQGADTRIALECACSELAGYSFTVPADKFIKAVTACDSDPKIELLENGKVKLSKKRFRATLPMLSVKDYPMVTINPEDDRVECPPGFVDALKRVLPFVNQNKIHSWSSGVYLAKGYVYATDGLVLVRSPVEWNGLPLNIPAFAVKEITNISREITAIRSNKNSITLEYGDAWLNCKLYTDTWPESATTMLSNISNLEPIPDGLLVAVEKLVPFCPEDVSPVVHFKDSEISTSDGSQSAQIGFDVSFEGSYRAELLQRVLDVAKHWSPSAYPKPLMFTGDKIEGLLAGVRK